MHWVTGVFVLYDYYSETLHIPKDPYLMRHRVKLH